MSLLLLLRPKYPTPSGGLPSRRKNNQPWLSFPKDERRRTDDDDVVILLAL